jgi:hypothetical protein
MELRDWLPIAARNSWQLDFGILAEPCGFSGYREKRG